MSGVDAGAAHARLVALFERLAALDPMAREAALAACDPATRARLQRLLAADGEDHDPHHDPLALAIARQAAEFVAPAARGTRIGPYRVLRELGAGGMGAVLLAERADGQYAQQVAVKLIRGFPTDDGRRRLRQERQILAQLDHPNIARLLDGGETDDGQPYVVMEFVNGAGLLEHIAAHAPTLRQRLLLFDRIAAAVQHAHERLVIHRDIKPGNVLVRMDGEPRLLDFGVAKLVDLTAAADQPQTSTRVWTPGYASPEQRSGGAITTATDVYALALLLREMLTGERAGGQKTCRLPGFLPLILDADLRGILAQGSAERPADRYPTVEALRADLQRWRDGRPVRAAADTAWYRGRKFVGRHRAGVIVLLLAIVGSAGFVWQLAQERSRALQAEARAGSALLLAQRDAATARAALAFLTDVLAGSMPERALSSRVNVRDLLDQARAELDRRQPDVQLRRPVQRLLGRLYHSLGEPQIAAGLFAAGLQDAQALQRDEALALADDLDSYGGALGALERGPEGLAVAQQGAELRRRFAPDDPEQELRALDQLGYGYYRIQDFSRAEANWVAALEIAGTLPAPPLDVVTNIYQAYGSMLGATGAYQRAVALADQGLAFADRHLPPTSPLRVNLMRTRAEALGFSGRLDEAERLLREAIELQQNSVGNGGVRLASLYNGLGVVLNDLGRYREAVDALQQARALERPAGGAPMEDAIGTSNLAATLESAGDYAQALTLFEQALATLDGAGVPADDPSRRRLERSHARCLALAGQHARAAESLTLLRQRARELEGEASFEYAMTTWQAALVARRMQDRQRGLSLLEEARQLFALLLPDSHAVFSHVLRAEAAFALMQGQPELAERAQRQAVDGLLLASLPVDVAIARSELAAILADTGRHAAARTELDLALPVLRDALLPTEVSRAAAEALAVRLTADG